MQWLALSIISACMSSVWSLTVKAGLEHIKPVSFVAWYSVGAAIIIAVGLSVLKIPLGMNGWGLAAGVFAGLAGVGLSKSFSISPNPGFSMGAFRMQAVATAIISYFLFGTPLPGIKILGMLIACGGVIQLARGGGGKEGFLSPKEEKTAHPHDQKHLAKHNPSSQKSVVSDLHWLWLAGGAGLLMSVKDVATKKALMGGGQGALGPTLFSCALAQACTLLAATAIKNHSLQLEVVNGAGANKPLLYVAATSAAFAMYQATVIGASKSAPNVGLVKAIDTLGLVLTTFGSHFFFNSPVSIPSLEGIAIILLGVLVMCFSGAESEWWQSLGARYRAKLCQEKGICVAKGADWRMLDALTGWHA